MTGSYHAKHASATFAEREAVKVIPEKRTFGKRITSAWKNTTNYLKNSLGLVPSAKEYDDTTFTSTTIIGCKLMPKHQAYLLNGPFVCPFEDCSVNSVTNDSCQPPETTKQYYVEPLLMWHEHQRTTPWEGQLHD